MSTVGNVSEVLPPQPVLSSAGRAWRGLEVMQLRHSLTEVSVPAFASHIVTLYLGRPSSDVFKVDGRRYKRLQTKGDLVVLPAGVPSEWQWSGLEQEQDDLYMHLTPAFVSEVAAGADLNPDGVELVARFDVRDSLIEHVGMALLAELKAEGVAGRLYAESLATQLAVQLLRRYTAAEHIIREHKGELAPHRLRRALDYINDDLARDLTLTEVARHVGISPYWFARMFKQSTGLAPHRYVIEQRIAQAKRLLSGTKLPIAEIALQIGCHSQSQLNNLFRRHAGTTPKAYRDDSDPMANDIPCGKTLPQ